MWLVCKTLTTIWDSSKVSPMGRCQALKVPPTLWLIWIGNFWSDFPNTQDSDQGLLVSISFSWKEPPSIELEISFYTWPWKEQSITTPISPSSWYFVYVDNRGEIAPNNLLWTFVHASIWAEGDLDLILSR